MWYSKLNFHNVKLYPNISFRSRIDSIIQCSAHCQESSLDNTQSSPSRGNSSSQPARFTDEVFFKLNPVNEQVFCPWGMSSLEDHPKTLVVQVMKFRNKRKSFAPPIICDTGQLTIQTEKQKPRMPYSLSLVTWNEKAFSVKAAHKHVDCHCSFDLTALAKFISSINAMTRKHIFHKTSLSKHIGHYKVQHVDLKQPKNTSKTSMLKKSLGKKHTSSIVGLLSGQQRVSNPNLETTG